MHDSEHAEQVIERGLVRSRADDWLGAAEAFRKAASLDPASAEARFRLGWALWKRAEELKPTLGDLGVGYLAQLAGLESVARDRARKFTAHKRALREAAHWLREAIARDGRHARAVYFLARTMRELGYRQEALDMARRAAEAEPTNSRYGELVQAWVAEGRAPGTVGPAAPAARPLCWNDIVLPPRTKRELRQMQLMLEKPELARDLGVDLVTGILLKGAPGTGKTTVARILADEARCRFLSVTPADINQMFVGESEKRVRDLFQRARSAAPAIIFVDEIDALLPARQGGIAIHSDKVVNQFLQEMDGMARNDRVLVVGATNRPDMLDPAVRRGGRLSREIEIPLPDCTARRQLLDLFTRGARIAADVDLDALADATAGFSGADLKAVVNEAGLQALIRIADSEEGSVDRRLTAEDFRAAADNLRASEDEAY